MVKPHINKRLACTSALVAALFSTLGGCSSNSSTTAPEEATEVSLGRTIFFDKNLSSNANQSCATCHHPLAGFADPNSFKETPVSEGSVTGAFGNRNAPTSAYASFAPDFRLTTSTQTSEEASKYEGGQFLDGRSIDLVEQAKAPFLNPVEMNNVDEAEVVNKVMNSSYADDFRSVFGETAFDNVSDAYTNIATAIAAFESATEMNPFTSKFDAFQADPVSNPLTDPELRGFNLFKATDRAKCVNCHTIENPTGGPALFTNFKYFNIGTPSNPDNPSSTQDLGLGGVTSELDQDGKFKVPTLRNIELTAPYMHNGRYQTLEEVINHYDIFGDGNIFPEVNRNIAPEMNEDTFTVLGFSTQETADLVAFMKTLTDGYF